MLKRSGIIFSLGFSLIISLCVPPWCQAEPGRTTHSSEMAVRATPPLIKITPRPDGKFLLEPLTPPPKSLIIPPSPPTQKGERTGSTPPTSYNQTAPGSFIQLVLSKVRHARYVWGTSLETGSATDCSGFTQYIYRICKIDLPRSSAEQAEVGKEVTRSMDFSKLEAGDLLFFRDSGRAVGHVGLYLGEGKMIHAASSRAGVTVSELDQEYYVNNFVVAKRVFEKTYKWAAHPGLSPVARNRDWDFPVATALSVPKPLLFIARPVAMLLKIFWPWKYRGFTPSAPSA